MRRSKVLSGWTVALSLLVLIAGTQAVSGVTIEYPMRTILTDTSSPARLALDSSQNLYITDPWGTRVLVYDSTGSAVTQFTPSQTAAPLGIAIWADGSFALSDAMTGSVDLYDAGQNYVGSLGAGDGEFGLPCDLEIDRSTGHLYVVDSASAQISEYDSTGSFIGSFGASGTGPSEFIKPTGISISEDGTRLYVADQANGRVQVFDSNKTYLREFGSMGSLPGQFVRVQGIAASTSGFVCASDSFLNSVQLVDSSDGAWQTDFGEMGLLPGDGFLQAVDAELDETNGLLYVASHNTLAVEVFQSAGVIPTESAVPDWYILEQP
ncbi:NHL repeat-containing protein [bacterium]|nr:NHL repeat-containing protein [bacterium]